MSVSRTVGGSQNSTMTNAFGRTYVVRPKGIHQATIVWLHGLGDNGSSWPQQLESLHLPNVKWICPTAPTRPVSLFGGHASTAWFDVDKISEDGPDDLQGLDASAAHVANLLSAEPANIKLGIGGFSMGAATALHFATCHIFGQYGNTNSYQVNNLSSVIGLSGWLPCSRTLTNRIGQQSDVAVKRRAELLPVLLCHGFEDDVVAHKYGEDSERILRSSGFHNLTFILYDSLGHYTIREEMDEVCRWLSATLGLERQ